MSPRSVLRGSAWATRLAVLLLSLAASTVPAQGGEDDEPRVVDEVIAQVNGDVVMLSMLKRELQQATETLERGGMPQPQAAEQAARMQARILVNLIDERLLLQKGKDLPQLSEDVEAEINRQMLQVAQQQGIKSIEALTKLMQMNGVDMAAIREAMRIRQVQQEVFSREVDAKIFRGLSETELRTYFDAKGPREAVFDEHRVRAAITQERAPNAREKYLHALRKEAYLKIAQPYEAGVRAILNGETR
jgi:hypothetical protein